MVILKLIVAAIFILSGCATNPTEGMTPAEAKAYGVQAEYERTDRRIRLHEAILTARAQCKAANMVWWTHRFNAFENRRMVRDPTWLPKHASTFDFACLSQHQAADIMRRLTGQRTLY